MPDANLPIAELVRKPPFWQLKRAWNASAPFVGLGLGVLAVVWLFSFLSAKLPARETSRQGNGFCINRVEYAPTSASVLPPDRVRVVWTCAP